MATKKAKKKKATEEWMPYEDLSQSIAQVSEGYLQLCEAWTDFQEGIGSRIDKNAKEQRKTYEDFASEWTEFYKTIGSRASKNAEDLQLRELYDIWRNYSNKMYNRLTTVMNTTTERHENLQKNWRDSSKDFNSQLSALASGGQIDWQQSFLYDSWRGFTSDMQKWMEDTAEQGSEELNQLTETWTDFYTKMGRIVNSLEADGESYRDFVELWGKQSDTMGKNLRSLVSSNNGGFEGLQKAWFEYLSRVEKEVIHLTRDFGTNYDELWKWYFDSQEPWQEAFNLSTRKENEYLKKQLKELTNRVKKLEKSR